MKARRKSRSSPIKEDEEIPENNAAKELSNGSLSTTTNTKINHRAPAPAQEEANVEWFSMARVRRLMKSEADPRSNRDALFLISAAAARFLHHLVQDAYEEGTRGSKMPALSYKHLSSVVSKRKRYEFLSDFVPEKVKAKDALSEMAAVAEEM